MNYEQFLSSLPYLVKGMLGIFVVTAVIVLAVVVLNAASKRFGK